MANYNVSRNFEASLIDYLTTEVNASWSNVSVEKTFNKVYSLPLPIICVRVGNTTHDKAEIGENSTWRTAQVLIDIFATSDGMRLDLKDFLIKKLKGGLPYFEYTTANGAVDTKIQNGRIRVLEMGDTPVQFDADKNRLNVHDRFRHLLTLSVGIGRVET